MSRNQRIILIGFMFFAVVSAVTVWALSASANRWQQMQPATCMPNGCFCEAIRDTSSTPEPAANSAPFSQPSNTLSSLAYVLTAGLVIGTYATRTRRSGLYVREIDQLLYVAIFVIALIAIGVGSAFYHASMTFIGQFFDVFGMYLFTTFMLVYAWKRLYNLKTWMLLLLFVAMNIVLSVLLVVIPDTRRSLFAVVLIIAILFETAYQNKHRRATLALQSRWFIAGLLLFALAYAIWILDNTRTVCSPDSVLQGHALWHLLGAVAAGLLYVYYRSEDRSLTHK